MSMVMLMTISIAISIRRINNNHNNDNIKTPPTTPAAVVGPKPTTTTTTTNASSSFITTPNLNTNTMMNDIETLYNIRTSVIENYQSRNEILKLGITPAVIYNELITGNWAAWIAEIQQEGIQHEAIQQQREDNDAVNDNETCCNDSNDGVGTTTTDTSNTKGGSIVNKGVGFSIADLSNRTIMGLFVRPEYHDKGIGKRLLQIAENWLWEELEEDSTGKEDNNANNANDIIWLTTSNNPKFRAYGFYQHVGWILDESYIHDSSSESENNDEVRYIKKRPP